LRAVVVSHAVGLSGVPSIGQRSHADERVLRALLGEVPVAGQPDEARDDGRPIASVGRQDGGGGVQKGLTSTMP